MRTDEQQIKRSYVRSLIILKIFKNTCGCAEVCVGVWVYAGEQYFIEKLFFNNDSF